MYIIKFYFSIWIFYLNIQVSLSEIAYFYKEKIGYIGPTCAVVGEELYVHGYFVRKLNESELEEFNLYQKGLGQFYDSVSEPNFQKTRYPTALNFCNGLDDSIEIVLNGCVVRNNRVYIEDRLIRPLNFLEREKINNLLSTRVQTTLLVRKKRFTDNDDPSIMSPGSHMPQNDMTEFLKSIMNVNTSVAERFLPVVKMSPILSEYTGPEEPQNDNVTVNEAGDESNVSNRNGQDSQDSPLQSAEVDGFERMHQKRSDLSSLESLTAKKSQPSNDAEDLNDPIVRKLIHSLTSGQHNSELAKQELTQKVGQHPPFYVLPPGVGAALKPGDTTIIGGQTYVAVPLSMAIKNGIVPSSFNTNQFSNFGSNRGSPSGPSPSIFPPPSLTNTFHSMAPRNTNFETNTNPLPTNPLNPNIPPFEPPTQNFGLPLPFSNSLPTQPTINHVNLPPFASSSNNNFGMPMMGSNVPFNFIPPSPSLPTGMWYSGQTVNTNQHVNMNPLPMSSFPRGFSAETTTHMPLPTQPQTAFNLPPLNLPNIPLPSSGGAPSPPQFFIPFNSMQVAPDAPRYHPGKREFTPMPLLLPSEICTAHIVDPFLSRL